MTLVCLSLLILYAQQKTVNADDALPRFASLRADDVNLRAGPGVRYPVLWKYQRRGLPVEITTEFEHWRRIRDWQGEEGWIHRSMLSSRRFLIVTDETRNLHQRPDPDSRLIARLAPGVLGQIDRCKKAWCSVRLPDYEGWLRRQEFWGVYPDEIIK